MDHSPGFLKLAEAAKARVQEISASEAAERTGRGEATLVDVREDREWDAGHPAGAVHLARGIIERDIEKAIPDPAAPVILMCGGGYRSALAAESLERMGYKNVLSLRGGWTAWNEAGLPAESGTGGAPQ